MWVAFLLHSFLSGMLVSSSFLFSLSLFFFLLFYPVMSRVSCRFGGFKFFCQHSVDVLCVILHVDEFFDVFVGEGEHVLLLSCHLASSPLKHLF